MLDKKARRDIALDYWFYIALAIGTIIWHTWGGQEPTAATYFIATAFILHAHGNRIRATILALHKP